MRRRQALRSNGSAASGVAVSLIVCSVAWGLPARAAAQGSEPLHKSDLIRLLADPLIQKQEVAALVRRNCLAFRPTEGDWTDLRAMGADADVLSSVGVCAARSVPKRAVALPVPERSEPWDEPRSAPARASAEAPSPRLEAVVVREQPERADSTATTFVPSDLLRGVVRHHVPQAIAFLVRGASGQPLPGRVVVFRAHNATVAPDRALTDSEGLVQLDVTLGSRVGTAGVRARVDSVEKHLTVLVSPGPPVDLSMERDSVRVDGGDLRVVLGVPFDLMLKAHDGYGNLVSSPELVRQLEELRAPFNAARKLLRLVRVRAHAAGAVLTFQPVAVGSTDLTLAVSGVSKSVRVDIGR